MGASPVRGVAGLCFESTDGDIAGSAKEGGCFSSCSGGCSSYCFFFSAWKVARYTVLLASIGLALGPVVRLLARSLYYDILHVVSADTQGKVLFWQ